MGDDTAADPGGGTLVSLAEKIGELKAGQRTIFNRLETVENDIRETREEVRRTREAVEGFAGKANEQIAAALRERKAAGGNGNGSTNGDTADREALAVGRTLLGIPALGRVLVKNIQTVLMVAVVIFLAYRELRTGNVTGVVLPSGGSAIAASPPSGRDTPRAEP